MNESDLGLPEFDPNLSFSETFETYLAPLVAIDDIHCREAPNLPASKGLGVELFLEKISAEVVHDDYMKVWRLR